MIDIIIIINALYFFLPAYVANTAACVFGKGRPVDFKKNFYDKRRIIGDGVTIRGIASGVLCGTIVGALQQELLLGFLLSLGAMVGDMAGSFIKRRAGLERGAHAPILDQLNFVVGGLVLASLILPVGEFPLNFETVLILFVLTPVGHLIVNKTGYRLKMKDVPW